MLFSGVDGLRKCETTQMEIEGGNEMMHERVQFECSSAVGSAMAVTLALRDTRASDQRFNNGKITVDNVSNAQTSNCHKLSIRRRVSRCANDSDGENTFTSS
jgi:hypothetical protein